MRKKIEINAKDIKFLATSRNVAHKIYTHGYMQSSRKIERSANEMLCKFNQSLSFEFVMYLFVLLVS